MKHTYAIALQQHASASHMYIPGGCIAEMRNALQATFFSSAQLFHIFYVYAVVLRCANRPSEALTLIKRALCLPRYSGREDLVVMIRCEQVTCLIALSHLSMALAVVERLCTNLQDPALNGDCSSTVYRVIHSFECVLYAALNITDSPDVQRPNAIAIRAAEKILNLNPSHQLSLHVLESAGSYGRYARPVAGTLVRLQGVERTLGNKVNGRMGVIVSTPHATRFRAVCLLPGAGNVSTGINQNVHAPLPVRVESLRMLSIDRLQGRVFSYMSTAIWFANNAMFNDPWLSIRILRTMLDTLGTRSDRSERQFLMKARLQLSTTLRYVGLSREAKRELCGLLQSPELQQGVVNNSEGHGEEMSVNSELCEMKYRIRSELAKALAENGQIAEAIDEMENVFCGENENVTWPSRMSEAKSASDIVVRWALEKENNVRRACEVGVKVDPSNAVAVRTLRELQSEDENLETVGCDCEECHTLQ